MICDLRCAICDGAERAPGLPIANCTSQIANGPCFRDDRAVNPIVFLILAYVAAAVQVGLSPALRLWGAVPDFMLIAAAVVWVSRRSAWTLVGSILLGLLADLLSGGPIGM